MGIQVSSTFRGGLSLYESFFEPQIVRENGCCTPGLGSETMLFQPYILLEASYRDHMLSGSFGGAAFCREHILECMKKQKSIVENKLPFLIYRKDHLVVNLNFPPVTSPKK